MGLICSRIGCREKAAASLQFDAERSTAILIDLTHARNGMPLCERHASSRTAPVGWQMVDRRTGARQMEIWSAEDEARPAPEFAAPTERPATRRPVDEVRAEATGPAASSPHPSQEAAPTERPAARRPEPDPEPAAATKAEDGPDETGFHWPKHGDEHDEAEDEKEGLAADSPLLSRAFRAAK
ncbi:MAG: DUF3499 family protein [Acidimicrobiales bacterium]